MDWQIFWVPVCIVLLCYVIVLHVKVKKITMQKKKISEQAEAYRKICIRLKEAQKEDEPELDSQLEVLGYETCEKKQKEAYQNMCALLRERQKDADCEASSLIEAFLNLEKSDVIASYVLEREPKEKFFARIQEAMQQKNDDSSVILEELRQQRQQLTVMLEDAIAESRYLEDTLSKLDNREK